ncbi:MAG: acyl-CoA thioesterase [Polyangiaceae bacterium]|nr:acyl-CoA thioesterase [Polyangiaceae bacterium]MCW5790695.1 acyl-CoA thioesterase [Polyangiaceae bacterium]
MYRYERPVRFQEIDAAGLLFFPTFLSYCHEAMESWCGALPGGYAGLVGERRIGLPAVQVEASFRAPLRYGDVARIELEVTRVGARSLGLRYQLSRAAVRGAATAEATASEGGACAVIDQVVVCTDLSRMQSLELPPELRALAEQHLAAQREPI